MPLTVITTVDERGLPNAAPYGCVMPVLRPLDLIALASAHQRDTLNSIGQTGEFVVNLIGPGLFKKPWPRPRTSRRGSTNSMRWT